MNTKFEAYKNKFEIKATENGYSVENINKCLAYAETLINRDLPVIYSTSHFCSLVGYNKSYIKKAALYSKSFYRSFPIKKKDGGSR
jgi:RNA-directed DNA polymerase